MTIAPATFVKQAIDELRKVTWPTRTEITRLTVTVIIISAVVGIFLGGIDYVLTKAMELVLK